MPATINTLAAVGQLAGTLLIMAELRAMRHQLTGIEDRIELELDNQLIVIEGRLVAVEQLLAEMALIAGEGNARPSTCTGSYASTRTWRRTSPCCGR
jgi:hypothetical protein